MQFGHGPFAAAAPVPISKIGKLSTEALAEALKRTSYENVPNSLMGFKRFGPQKEWADQGYKYIQYVKIKWPDGTTSIDAQKGLNAQHALERAYRNWMDASEITPISKEEAIKLDPSASGW
jgi:hypothetical protein